MPPRPLSNRSAAAATAVAAGSSPTHDVGDAFFASDARPIVRRQGPFLSPSPSSFPSSARRTAHSRVRPSAARSRQILFDGVCLLCNAGVDFMLRHDVEGKARFAALQSPAGSALLRRCGRQPGDISSIVLVERGASFVRSDAILRIAQLLSVPWPLLGALGLLVPRFVRDPVYDAVANNRYRILGRLADAQCRLRDDRFEARFVQ